MDFNRIIIYTDVDGTAVASDHNINALMAEDDVEALKEFVGKGGLLGVASGRSHNSVNRVFDCVGINMPIIEANGAYIYDNKTKEYISKTFVSEEVKKEVYEYVKAKKDLYLTCMHEDGTKRVAYGDGREEIILDFSRPFISKEEFFERSNSKVGIVGNEEKIDKVFDELKQLKSYDKMTVRRSAPIYAEIFDYTVNKGVGVKKAIENSKIKDRKLVCIGDYYNDIDMLEIADIAICPITAPEEVKKICKYITKEAKKGCLQDAISYLKRI